MTKVTITAPAEGNEPDMTPARAVRTKHELTTSDRASFQRDVATLKEVLLEIDTISEARRSLLDQALALFCKKHDTAEARKVWSTMARDLRRTHDKFKAAYSDWNDDGNIERDKSPAGAAYSAAVAASLEGAGVVAAFQAQVGVERYARFLAFGGVYANYACNPPALAELTRSVSRMQLASRQYADDFAPILKALAIEAAFFSPRRVSPQAAVTLDDARAAIAAEAADCAKLVTQAQDAFNEADEAWTRDRENRSPGLAEKREALEQAWWDCLDQHHAIAKRVFNLPATTPQEISDNVAAYVDIMAPIVGTPDFEPALENMPSENLLEVIGYLASQAGADLSEPKAVLGREAVRAAWDQARAKAKPDLIAAE